MTTRYAWPVCTLPECDHFRTHKGEQAALRYRKNNTRQFTTPDGNAVCACHDTWEDGFQAPWPLPRALFKCDQSRTPSAVLEDDEPAAGLV